MDVLADARTRTSLEPRRSTARLIWAGPAVLSLLVSLACIGRSTLWRDEMATRQFALLPLTTLWAATSHVDRVLTPYYTFMHFWANLGDGGIALRLPSAIAASITVGICARLAQAAWGSAAGLVTGLALALNGVFIAASIEARPYALEAMLCVAATLMLTKLVDNSARRRTWWIYATLVCAATLIHVFAVLILLAHALIFWRPERRRLLIRWIITSSPAALVAAVLVLISLRQSAQLSWIGESPNPRDVARLGIAETGESLSAAVLIFAVLFMVAVQLRARTVDDLWLVSVGMLGLPTAALFVASHLSTPVLVARYVITIQIAAALLLGAAVARLNRAFAADRRTRTLTITVAAILVIISVSASNLRATVTSSFRGDDYRAMATALSSEAQPGDALAVRTFYAAGGFAGGVAYYLGDSQFTAFVTSSLVQGEPVVYTRKIVTVAPFTTSNARGRQAGTDVWVVELASKVDPAVDPLTAQGCKPLNAPDGTATQQFGDISMGRFHCPNGFSS